MNRSLKINGKGEGLHIVLSLKAKDMDRMKNLVELEEGKKLNGSSNEDRLVKAIWESSEKKNSIWDWKNNG